MKLSFSVIVCLLSVLTLSGQTSFSTQDTIRADYAWSQQSPTLYTQGTELYIETDSIYAVNAPRYRFYQEMHEAYLQKNATQLSEIILRHYENSLVQRDSIVTLLFINNWETELRVDEISREWRTLQTELMHTLHTSQSLLNSSNRQLELTTETLKKSNRKKRFGKIVIATAGAGIGVLLGRFLL
jgi:hypothetical protein